MRVSVERLASGLASAGWGASRWLAVLAMAALGGAGLSIPVQADTPAPLVSFINGSTYTNADSLQFTVYFDQFVVNVDATDFEVSGTTAGVTTVSPSGPQGFAVTVSGGDLANLNGEVRLGIASGNDIQNLLGTPLGAFDPSVADATVVNNTPPNCAFSTTEPAPVTGNFLVDITCLPQDGFADGIAVWSFTESDLVVTNATIESFTAAANAAPGSVTLRPAGAGTITVNLPADSLYDEASNPNTASTEFSIEAAIAAPEISFSTTVSSPVNAPYTLTITFSEDVTGFSASSIGAAGAYVSDFSAVSASVYTVLITPAGNGTHSVGVAANAATDADGYGNPAPDAFEMTYDSTAPTVNLSSGVIAPHQANTPFSVTVTFSEPVTGFDSDDVDVTGGVLQTLTPTSTGATLTLISYQDGTLTVDIPADSAVDAAGNGNSAASQFSLEIDGTPPTVTSVARTAPVSTPAQADTISWTVTFSEPVINVTANDFQITGPTVDIGTVNAVSSTVYELTTQSGGLSGFDGLVMLSLSATSNITDAAYNDLPDLSPTGLDERNVDIDNAGPVITRIDRASPTDFYTNADTLSWLFVFNETVENVLASDFALTGSTATLQVSVDDNEVTVTASGGDLASLSSQAVRISLQSFNTIEDSFGNSMSSTVVQGAINDIFVVDNAAPVLESIVRYNPATETTNQDDLTWRVVFDSEVVGLQASDFVVSGSTATVTSIAYSAGGKDGQTLRAGRPGVEELAGYYVNVSGGDLAALGSNGPVTVSLAMNPATSLSDRAGNRLSSPTPQNAAETYSVANTGPQIASITRLAPTDEVTNADSVSWAVNFSRISPTLTMAPEDFSLTGTTASLAVERFSIGFNVTASGGDLASLDGEIELTVSNATVADEFGNPLVSTTPDGTNDNTFQIDNTAPSVTLAYTGSEPISGVFSVDIAFSEDVSGFSIDDLDATNASVSNLQGSGSSFTADVTPSADGTVSLDIAGASYTDEAGNDGSAATTLTVESDVTAPTATLSSTAADPVAGAFEVSVEFSENVTGLTVAGFDVTNGTASSLMGSGTDYSVTITPAADGEVSVLVAADAAEDSAGNGTEASSALTRIADMTAPTPVLASTMAGPVSAAFPITITFDEDVTGFTVTDLVVTNGTVSGFSGSGADYSATVAPTTDGIVTVSLAAGAATDAAQNASQAAGDLEREADLTAPGVTLATAASGPLSSAFRVTASFDSAVTGFGLDDLVVTNGTASALDGSGDNYSFVITPTADGPVSVALPAGGAFDLAGNGNTAAEALSLEADLTAPGVVLTSDLSGAAIAPFTLTVTFSESVTGFALDDLEITNGEGSNLSGSGAVYTLTVTPTSGNPLTVALAAGAAVDAAGNASLAAEPFEVETDAIPPVLTLELPSSDVEGPFEAVFDFSEPVVGFTVDDVLVSNGDISGFTAVTSSRFTATITPQTLGTVALSIPQGAASDEAGNPSEAASGEVEAVSPPVEVTLSVGDTVLDVTQIATAVNISNPGSQAIEFRVDVDVPWLDVSPRSGTIAGLDSIQLMISVNDQAEALAAGSYTGRITVVNLSSRPARQPGALGAESESVVVSIPLTITIAERRGTIQLVATTPGGLQRDESFIYASGDADLDGISLTTSGGLASSSPVRKLFGTYDITQSLPQGWRLDSLSCSGDLDGGSVIDLAAGRVDIDLDPEEDIVCTFANTRDEAEVRLATQRAIRNFVVRRADRILDASPDLARRFMDRDTTSPGHVAVDMTRNSRLASLSTSLSGLRGHAKQSSPQMPGTRDMDTRSDWDVWLSANYSSVSDDRAGDLSESEFGIVQMGADWQVSEGRLFGVMLQRDWMDDVSEDIAARAGAVRGARVGGSGWMAGPYMVQQVREGVWLDAIAMYGASSNTVDPLGLYEDEFDTERYLLRVNLTGEWRQGGWRVRPAASLSHFEETQSAYTDSLGIHIPAQTITVGRFEAGPEVAYRFDHGTEGWWEPVVGLTGVWDYNPATLLDENGGLVGSGDVRADARFGVQGEFWGGAILRFTADVSGLGDGDFEARSARLEIRIGLQ
ncbi:MAG: hypothetical protein CMK09_09635 [Ponticaulis sp.]|nr:hypothetical protein [Ponticaulis sp.]